MATTIKEVGNWKLIKDESMGVTAFVNETIDFQSDWNTGSDAEEEIQFVKLMTDAQFISYAQDTIPLPF